MKESLPNINSYKAIINKIPVHKGDTIFFLWLQRGHKPNGDTILVPYTHKTKCSCLNEILKNHNTYDNNMDYFLSLNFKYEWLNLISTINETNVGFIRYAIY
jgi:hypothetical protein